MQIGMKEYVGAMEHARLSLECEADNAAALNLMCTISLLVCTIS